MTRELSSVKTAAQVMAEFAFALRYEAIPAEAIALARRHLADTLACALGAREAATVQALQNYAVAQDGRGAATVIGSAEKVPAALAALVNGAMVRQLDANDIFVSSRGGASGHFSDATAGIVAVAEQYRRSGEELITCLVASYELQGALAESLNFWEAGLHPVTNAAWTAPIVAARLAGATTPQAVQACGFAVATGTVLNTWIRTTGAIPSIKSIAVGLAMQRAVDAAELAARVATATDDALETVFSTWNAKSGARFGAQALEQLGSRWTMPRNMLKRFPAQIHTQAAVEAAIELYRRGIRAERISKLRVYGNRRTCGGVQGSAQAFAPASREAADHSTPYVVAMALLRGRLTQREYIGDPWKTAEVKSVMAKIELMIDPELERGFEENGNLGVRLVAIDRNGATEEIVIEQPKGHPDRSLSDGELVEKIAWLLAGHEPALNPQHLLDQCQRISAAEDVTRLLAMCSAEQR